MNLRRGMLRLWLVALAAMLTIALVGCQKAVRLYPANAEATAGGVLEGRYVAYGTGHGVMEISTPDGELLRGEYTIFLGGSPMNIGRIYASVYGSGGSASGLAPNNSDTILGRTPGTASLLGIQGPWQETWAECEFFNDNMSGDGYGACRMSSGALYRLQY